MSTATISRPGPNLLRLQEQPTAPRRRVAWLGSSMFILMHVACLGVFLTAPNLLALTLCVVVYLLQMVGITAGYHRYFAHRSYKTGRVFQFALAWLGCSASQRGPLWWAAQHRHHHRTSDTPEDRHSPVSHSFWQSHIGWVLSPESDATDGQTVKDLSRNPELRWLDRNHWLPPLALAGLCSLLGGWGGLVWGFFVSSVLSHHATFLVNSVCHLWGRRRYATADASRNNLLVALLTLGEGWHNNHHHYQSRGHAAAPHPETMKMGCVVPRFTGAVVLDEGRWLLGASSPQSRVAWTLPRTRNCRPHPWGARRVDCSFFRCPPGPG
jgi:stearoyl-CoA desaturase (Delta-9 desaturase)